MKDRKIIGIFAVVLIVSSSAKLFGLSLHPVMVAYEKVGTTIMAWITPEMFIEISTGVYPTSVKTLTIYMPILFTICLGLEIFHLIKYRKRGLVSVRSGKEETDK